MKNVKYLHKAFVRRGFPPPPASSASARFSWLLRLAFSFLIFQFSILISHSSFSQTIAQQRFHKQIPPGNYSGICPLGNDLYAVVDDKAPEDGFYVFRLAIDTLKNRITAAENLGYRSCGLPNRDMEGICYRPSTRTLFISGESDNEVFEYSLDGQRTGRKLTMPSVYKKASRNLGLESLTYDTLSHRFFTTSERPLPGDTLLRIQSFGDDLQPLRQYLYLPDAPISRKYYYGVSELCAMHDGRLLVLERQVRVPRLKLNAHTVIRIYEVQPGSDPILQKRLLKEFHTRLTLTSRKFANYEGLCALSSNLLLLIADSQYQYKGFLRDWFMLLPLP